MHRNNDKKKALLARKDRILQEIKYYEKRIEEFPLKKSVYIDGNSSDSDDGFPAFLDIGPSISELKHQDQLLRTCLQATQELTSIGVLQSEVNVMVQDPVIEGEKAVSEPGSWREVTAECRIDLVPFSITFYTHQPSRKFAAASYRGLRVLPVKAAHEAELSTSVLASLTNPSDAIEVLRSYSTAYRSRRTTLARLADKFANNLYMEPLGQGGFVLKCAELLEMSWRLDNKLSSVAPFHHKMNFDLEYMDESYLKIIKLAHRQLSDPTLQTDERTILLAKIISTCLEAHKNTQQYESMDSEMESIKKHERTILDDDKDITHEKTDEEVMAPPKAIPKKVKPKGKENKDDNRKSVKRSAGEVVSTSKKAKGDTHEQEFKVDGKQKNVNEIDNVKVADKIQKNKNKEDFDGNLDVTKSKVTEINNDNVSTKKFGTKNVDSTKNNDGTKKVDSTKTTASTKNIDGIKNTAVTKKNDGIKTASTKHVDGTKNSASTKNIDGTKNTASTKNIDGTKNTASTKNIDGTKNSASTKNIDGTKNTASTKNIDGTKNTAGTKNTDGTKNTASTKNIDGTKNSAGTKNIDGTKNSAGTKNIDGTKNSAGTKNIDGTKNTASTKNVASTKNIANTKNSNDPKNTAGNKNLVKSTKTQDNDIITNEPNKKTRKVAKTAPEKSDIENNDIKKRDNTKTIKENVKKNGSQSSNVTTKNDKEIEDIQKNYVNNERTSVKAKVTEKTQTSNAADKVENSKNSKNENMKLNKQKMNINENDSIETRIDAKTENKQTENTKNINITNKDDIVTKNIIKNVTLKKDGNTTKKSIAKNHVKQVKNVLKNNDKTKISLKNHRNSSGKKIGVIKPGNNDSGKSKIPQKKLSPAYAAVLKQNPIRISPRMMSKFKSPSDSNIQSKLFKPVTNIPRLLKKPAPKSK